MIKSCPPKLFSGIAGLLIAITLCVSWVDGLALPAGADTTPSGACGISSTSLPVGMVGNPYSATLEAGGGTLPYTWSIVSGALPVGLGLSSTGIISGIPLAARTYSFSVRADDSASHYCTMSISIQVNSNTLADNLTTIQTLLISKSDNLTLVNGRLIANQELASADGRMKLKLEAGTVINLQGQSYLGAAVESNPPAATDNTTLVRAYSFIPSGATFAPAATLTLRYESASLPAGATESSLYLAYWSGSAWEKLFSTVNTTLKEVSAPVAHFTTFAIRCPAPSTSPTAPTPTAPSAATGNVTLSANILGTTTAFITSGGVLTSAVNLSSTGGKLSISLADNTTVSLPSGSRQITVIQLASPAAAPAGSKLVEAYSFGPDNTTFHPAVGIAVQYDTAALPADVQEGDLYIAIAENSTWTPLPSAVNPQAKTVSAQVSRFTGYALLGKVTAPPPAPVLTPPPATAAFSTSDLAVSPVSAKAGEQVTVSVRVVNGGTAEAPKTVILKINDRDEAQKQITLAAGKSQVVNFNVIKSEPGQYTVSVDGQSTSFTVKESAAQSRDALSIPILIIIIAGGLLVIILAIVLIMKQM